MMTPWHGNAFRITILPTGILESSMDSTHKHTDLWYFFFVVHLNNLLNTIELLVLWDAMALMRLWFGNSMHAKSATKLCLLRRFFLLYDTTSLNVCGYFYKLPVYFQVSSISECNMCENAWYPESCWSVKYNSLCCLLLKWFNFNPNMDK